MNDRRRPDIGEANEKKLAQLRRRVETILDAIHCQSEVFDKLEKNSIDLQIAKENEASLYDEVFRIGLEHNAILELGSPVSTPLINLNKREFRKFQSMQRNLIKSYAHFYEVHAHNKLAEEKLGIEDSQLELNCIEQVHSVSTYFKQTAIEARFDRARNRIAKQIEKLDAEFEKASDKYEEWLDKFLVQYKFFYYVELGLEDHCLAHGLRYRIESDDLTM